MTSLHTIYQSWNQQQQQYYKPLFDSLIDNDITTAELLRSQDVQYLFNRTKITKQIIKAFIRQVIYDTLPAEQEHKISRSLSPRVYISTGFDSLDNLLVPDKQGISSHQIIEICGSVNSEVSVLTANLLSSYIIHYKSLENIRIYDTSSGILESKRMASTFKKRGPDPNLLNQIESHETLSAGYVLDQIEDLIALSPPNSLIIIDDLSQLLNNDWSNRIVGELAKQSKLLVKKSNSTIVFLRDTLSKQELLQNTKLEPIWNPMIDTRFYLSDDSTVEIIKSRDQLIDSICKINMA